jgi:large subunit ribosomal protein L10
MPRPEKVQAVADITERFSSARAVFASEYAGLSVKEQQQLRRALRAADSEFRVYKMTLARIAATELGRTDALDLLVGPTGLAFANGDAAAVAKVLRDFAKDHAKLVIKGALLGSEVLPPERVAELADIEPREVLLAKIAGAFQAPMARMAGLLAAMPRNLATMMQQLIEKMPADPGAASEAPAPEAEAPVAEMAAQGEDESAGDDATTTEDAAAAAPEDTTDTVTEDAAEPAEEE